MSNNNPVTQKGYLKENYHYFHLRDTAGQELDFHFHDFDKIVLLISGRVDYLVEDRSYELKSYDVLLVRHHTIHKAVIDRSQPYERVIIYINGDFFRRCMPEAGLMDCFELSERGGSSLLTPDEGQREELKDFIAGFEAEQDDERTGAQAMRDTVMMQLLIKLKRMTAVLPQKEGSKCDEKIRQVMSYINEHLTEDLTVEKLAELIYMSKYHFMRTFKEQTGETVHGYVRQKRLLNAARLIREGTPAVKAAAESGFNDYSVFHRAFRKSFGMSPGKIKNYQ